MMATKSAVKPKPKDAGETPVRRRILEAAFSAFMERGFVEASTLEIATRARASKRELYALFGSKQDMLIACIGERLAVPRRREFGRHFKPLCALADAGDQHVLLAAEQRIKFPFRGSRSGCDFEC